MTISVRLADRCDLDFVSQDGFLSLDTVQRKIDAGEVVLAERTQPVGYARFELMWSRLPYLTLIWVLPEQRRQGVGRALLSYLEAMLQQRGFRALLSSSTATEAEPQAWHRHMGFRDCGTLAGLNEGGIGEVFFRKDL